MNHLSQFLFPSSITLSIAANEEATAVEEVMKLLEYDPRVSNWEELRQSILTRPTFPMSVESESDLVLYHGRTDSVSDFVMAVGRSQQGISFQQSEQPVRLIIIIGVPHALSNEYLRIMGVLARVIKEPSTFKKLLTTESVDEFIKTLSQECEN